jgi:hypothetical protein
MTPSSISSIPSRMAAPRSVDSNSAASKRSTAASAAACIDSRDSDAMVLTGAGDDA